MRRAPPPVWACAESVVTALGYSYVGAQYGRHGRGGLLRVFIDADGGVDVDDCARVSEQLSAALDVDDPIREPYVLEVSSPGFDRPLFSPEDFAAHTGQRIKVRLGPARDGRRNFTGNLREVIGERLVLEADGETWELEYADVDEAHVVPVY